LVQGRAGSATAYWRGLRDGFLKSGFGRETTCHDV
jgi:hypothetical protein